MIEHERKLREQTLKLIEKLDAENAMLRLALTWETDKPKLEGWYAYRATATGKPKVCHVYGAPGRLHVLLDGEYEKPVDDARDGWWLKLPEVE
jgi:hypothetical protein